jgi:hypothetical protein
VYLLISFDSDNSMLKPLKLPICGIDRPAIPPGYSCIKKLLGGEGSGSGGGVRTMLFQASKPVGTTGSMVDVVPPGDVGVVSVVYIVTSARTLPTRARK